MKEFITTTEAAKQMTISVKEVRILCRNGALSGAYKDSNGQWQVPIDTVTNWVRERGLVNQPQWKIISLVLAQKWLPGPRMRRVITLLGAVITLIGVTIAIANDYEGAVTQLKKWGILDEIDPAEESELLVVVTEFKGNGNYDPTTRIYDALVETIEYMGIENVRVEHIFDSPLNRQEAISIGNRYGASLLIWGNFDNAGINPRLERLQEAHILSGLDGSSHIINTDFESYHFYIVNELPNLYEYFTLIAIGQIYVHKGDFDSGINIFTQALDLELPTQGLDVGVAEAYRSRGYAHFWNSSYENARLDFVKTMELDPTQIGVYTSLATIQFFNNEYQAALQTLQQEIDINSDYWLAYDMRGLVYYYMEEYDIALQEFSLALELFPGNYEIPDQEILLASIYGHRGLVNNALGDVENARNDYLASIANYPTDGIGYHNLGFLELDEQNYDLALDYFQSALQEGYEDPKTYQGRGIAYQNLGNYDAAMRDFEHVINIAPDYGGGYIERGNLYLVTGHLENALVDFNTTLEIWPDNITAHRRRYLTFMQLGRYEDAINDLTAIIELEPTDIRNYLSRGHAILLEESRSPLEALSDFQTAVDLDPQNPNGYVGRATVNLRVGNVEEAFADYERALALDGGSEIVYFARGEARLALGDYQNAIQDLTKAIELDPNKETLYWLRSLAYLGIDEIEAALLDCQRYATLADNRTSGDIVNECLFYDMNDGTLYSQESED